MPRACLVLSAAVAITDASISAKADEGGVSFWLPGQYGSFAAVPMEPGWSLPFIYYHTSVEASASKSFEIGGFIAAKLASNADLALASPTYVFSDPVFNGQLALSMAGIVGSNETTGTVSVTGPGGGQISAERTDSLFSVGDLYPTAALRWNKGTSNFLAYLAGDIPVGDYQTGRLSNLGIGHGAIDAGGGYTYLDPKAGHELSAVAGFTYNFENPDTDYQNGIDFHLDWAASQFISETTHLGVVGYFYQQVTGDSGSGAKLGSFESRVAGIGPELGYFFPLGGHKAYLNLKGYYEFAGENRLSGWNTWLTFAVPLGGAASTE